MLGLSFPDTCSANPLRSAVAFVADIRIRVIERVAVLAMRFRSVAFELSYWRVVEILSMRDQLQVLGPDARGSDAAMMDFHPVGNLTVGECVGKAMRQPRLACFSKVAVSSGETPAIPCPAVTGLVDLSPKTFLKRPDYLFRPLVRQWVAVALPSAVVHLAPSTLLSRVHTSINRALHVSIVALCPVEGIY